MNASLSLTTAAAPARLCRDLNVLNALSSPDATARAVAGRAQLRELAVRVGLIVPSTPASA